MNTDPTSSKEKANSCDVLREVYFFITDGIFDIALHPVALFN